MFGPGVPTACLNPRNYAFVPSEWTMKIRPAGRLTSQSEGTGALLQNVYAAPAAVAEPEMDATDEIHAIEGQYAF